MSKYIKVLVILVGVAAFVIFTTMNATTGYRDQPLQSFLPCDVSKVIYAEDLGAQAWTADSGFIYPEYKAPSVSIEYVHDILTPYTKSFTYTGKRLSEKSFQPSKAYGFYDQNGLCLFEIFSKDDTVLVRTAGKTVKLKRKKV